ncbi:phosphotransferase enzyme family protein [Pseudonocardia acaciae]|uniref:phosphotransferase enzyme family protein n=1 Tax=Pseudonocardia acaciae TaxID=551276 RepID=UPI00048B6BEE|nr:aminoglycoside phosphotransferase family protein [Pseudonocardia acaciae]
MNDELAARVVRWVGEDFGLDLGSVAEVRDGADEAALLWRGDGEDGARYAVKLTGGGTAAGLVVSAHLAEHGVPGVVGPVRTRDGRLYSEREGRRLSVSPWVSGRPALESGMAAEHWVSFGRLLARAHATKVTDAMATDLPREEHDHERWEFAVRSLDARLGGLGLGGGDRLVADLAREWRGAAGLVSSVLERADALGERLSAGWAPGVVCHGDPHLGNLLLGPHGRVWLIDWDDAVLAPRERDLMFVFGGVLYFALVGPEELGRFMDGYGPVEVNPERMAYYRCVRALEDLAVPAAQVLDAHRHGDRERADALAIVRGVLSPTGLVRQALSEA